MKTRNAAAAAALLLTAASVSPATAATYIVNLSGNGVSATGSIETDGTQGALTSTNVTDWTLNLNDGTSTFTLDGRNNSQLVVDGSGFTATASGLFFNFAGSGIALFQNPSIGSGVNFMCLAANFCGGGANRVSISVSQFGGGFSQVGVQQVASLASGGVPEPATWTLMILGFGAVGGAMRRRQSVAATIRFA